MAYEPTYTKVYDWALKEFGKDGGLVYSVIARYQSMRSGMCYASIDTLRKQVCISTRTFWSQLRRLKDLGAVIDLSPDRCGKPHDLIVADEGEYKRAKFGLVLPVPAELQKTYAPDA